MKFLLSLIVSLTLLNPLENAGLSDLHFLAGNWKMQNKASYENWTIKGNTLDGNSYKIKNGSKQIEEYLTIKVVGEKIIYTAKVNNQNDGKPIDFVLNKDVKGKFSFENLAHDFPKKIQYTKRNDTTLFVAVLGDGDKGFSYLLIKQK